MIYYYYANLQRNSEKSKFISEIMKRCRVGYPTVRTWIAKPGTKIHRNPKPVYWPHIAEITGIPEEIMFKYTE